MFELIALALFQFATLTGNPASDVFPAAQQSSVETGGGASGWGDGHISSDTGGGASGWGDGHLVDQTGGGASGWGDGHLTGGGASGWGDGH
ncbi:hypothetical protein [Hymenobacter cavernae]|uniref:Uncharacterized protein n=1 Tax=Hymenobacter cavernae TaxID=2044852 RepID=A0ABQ1TIL9_9BACT|nr:hypothetical protein [Hymenobacter cavernae]GGE96384.1 hypothetical protein GCM10011383_03910 [Hymenobacter cavernae]